ncbi:DNA helicase PIF1, ATP-dependent [Corchorus capsularis]|uniref:ATP-dependent DNA helicase n=1 Tax=Corchorus capsularis TaxID=210143 RepID=A0A1R3J4R4_COCAP|nr:DNA helicase PIF1, ATP-dependent [Corchorus capsularis]
MTSSQREVYLARRRAAYHARKNSNSVHNVAQPLRETLTTREDGSQRRSGPIRVTDMRHLARSRDQKSTGYGADPHGASTSTANATQGQQIELQNQSTLNEGSETIRVTDMRRLARSRDQRPTNYGAYSHEASTSTTNTTQGQQIHLQNQSTIIGGLYNTIPQSERSRHVNTNATVPNFVQRPRFLQMYVYDTEHETEYRMLENETLDRNLVEKIKNILDKYNPLVKMFRSLSRREDLHSCRLIIKDQPSNQPQYNSPTASQVAAIIEGGQDLAHLNGREIMVETISGRLLNVNDTQELLPGQTPQDRLDLLTRIFHSKFEEFKVDIVTKGVLGRVVAYVYVIEFQKRGLPHAHMLVVVDEDSKLNTPDEYDRVVRAEIPKCRRRASIVPGCNQAYDSWTISVKCVKYLYKYVYKGLDRVAMELCSASEHDEVQQFIDARWNTTRGFQPRENGKERRSSRRAIGRVYTVSPIEGERFYLRILLNNARGAKSFQDLLTVNGIVYPTFKQTAERRGLLENDDSIRQFLLEATTFRMPSALRRLFVTLLVYCQASGERRLWEEFYPFMVEHYPSSSNNRSVHIKNRLLQDLNSLFIYYGKRLTNYDLPRISGNIPYRNEIPKIIEDELSVHTPPEDLLAVQMLNTNQQHAYDKIISVVNQQKGGLFFIDGPGGTGKKFLYRAILATIRNDGLIALATATSRIAATLLPGGRTAHSRFKLPLNPEASSVCFIDKESDLAELIRRAAVIIWDEASMAHRRAFEALDRSLKDIMGNDTPFGGKVIVFGGDFRQTLPVVPKGTKYQTINSCLVRSPLWKEVTVISLKQNMRSIHDQCFTDFLLRVGNGKEPMINNDMIQVPPLMSMPWEGDQSVDHLIKSVFPNLNSHSHDLNYMVQRAILTLRNDEVDRLNEKIIQKFDGMEQIYYSIDSVEDDPTTYISKSS